MNKIAISIFSLFFPMLALAADSSFSFAPPPGDFSVIFLSNIFGNVDGVLAGTGSQIFGSIFAIFNSALLAIGGIVIMYTLIVSTINTAHEGEMLGRKWSSIWVPIRSTLGLALLIPKLSGYCLMQVFFMWVVVQGIGAADKVWEGALSYLNRGGVIVQPQINPITSMLGDKSSIMNGASNILIGQVCMLGLQRALELQREGYLNLKRNDLPPCLSPEGSMKTFCETAVPDFLSSVNSVVYQNETKGCGTQGTCSVPMPNFDSKSAYKDLNGICGKITWNVYADDIIVDLKKAIPDLTDNETSTIRMSRAIAIQNMYSHLSQIAQVMVNNSPALHAQPTGTETDSGKTYPNKVARQPYGIPLLSSGQPCNSSGPGCTGWGSDDANSSALLNGNQFQLAIAVYNGDMMATLNLFKQSKNDQNASTKRQFINTAQREGWIMAGSYFFNLARLTETTLEDADKTDEGSGLEGSQSSPQVLLEGFEHSNEKTPSASSCKSGSILCTWLQGDETPIRNVIGLIDGSTVTAPVEAPNLNPIEEHPPVRGVGSSTVYGYINNSVMVWLPGQPGLKPPPKFGVKVELTMEPSLMQRNNNFPCTLAALCMDKVLGELFYNIIFVNLYNKLLIVIIKIINTVISAFIAVPLVGMADIFIGSLRFIQQPEVNPIIALSNMGVNYINFASKMYIYLIGLSLAKMLLPFGWFIVPLIAMALPLLMAWLGTMMAIGFVTAYYVPFLPYMIFTFGSIAWLMAVIEAMVAAPIVALGVAHPEGEGAFGKGEHAIMILMNVFLRPTMMIIGYIFAIALSYVSVWVVNAGFTNVVSYLGSVSGYEEKYGFAGQEYSWGGGQQKCDPSSIGDLIRGCDTGYEEANCTCPNERGEIVMMPCSQCGVRKPPPTPESEPPAPVISNKYTEWAGIYAFFFSVLIYTAIYLIVVQKSFSLITYLPDKVLRWIGGQPEGIGQETAQWMEEVKHRVEEGGKKTETGVGQQQKQMVGGVQQSLASTKSGIAKISGGEIPPESTPPKK